MQRPKMPNGLVFSKPKAWKFSLNFSMPSKVDTILTPSTNEE